jgi:hypothetical protein
VAAGIGERRVGAARTREVGIDFNGEPDIHHQQKRRPTFRSRKCLGVALGLAAGSHHGFVPAGRVAAAVSLAVGGRVG